MLHIVSTPIGNMDDITIRAINILKETNIIVCEDTRRTSKILKHYNIPKKQLIVYNDYNKSKLIPKLLEILKKEDIAFVTDNGTPCISDPGYNIIKHCIENDIKVSPVPGASAFLAALSSSGLPTDKFTFYGFLPKTSGRKEKMLTEMKDSKHTSIFYESPHRIEKTVALIKEIMPENNIVIAREITKKFEEFIRGKVKDVQMPKAKGEFVIIIS